MTMKKVAKLEEELTCQFKIGMRNLTILIRALENLKNLHFNGLPLAKVYDVSVKKVRRSYVWWHWILMQNLKENGLSLSKMTWGIWEIFTRALESLEIWTWWDSFIQSRECMSLKFTGELFVMTMKKNMQNWKRNWLVISKLTWGLWWILTWALKNLKNLHFRVAFDESI